jgi:hypothetical protein
LPASSRPRSSFQRRTSAGSSRGRHKNTEKSALSVISSDIRAGKN